VFLREIKVFQCVAVCCGVLQCVSVCCVCVWLSLCTRIYPLSLLLCWIKGVLLCVAGCCSALQRVAVRCSVFQCLESKVCEIEPVVSAPLLPLKAHCNALQQFVSRCNNRKATCMAQCNTLQHAAINYTVHMSETRVMEYKALQHHATYCNTLQHTTARCNTL